MTGDRKYSEPEHKEYVPCRLCGEWTDDYHGLCTRCWMFEDNEEDEWWEEDDDFRG